MTEHIEFEVQGIKFTAHHFIGHVFDLRTWSDTNVSGGGGYVNSSIEQRQKFWLRNAKNVDAEFDLTANVAVGQKVSVFTITNLTNDANKRFHAGFCNYASDGEFRYFPAVFKSTTSAMNLFNAYAFLFVIFTLGLALLLLVPLYFGLSSSDAKSKRIHEDLLARLREFAKETIDEEKQQPTMSNQNLAPPVVTADLIVNSKFCSHCGVSVPPAAQFCGGCGKSLIAALSAH